MTVRMLILKISIVLWLLIHFSQVASNSNIKSNCNVEYCGSHAIRYPFGISANCYHDEWFEIDCREGSTPYLKSINVRVSDISDNSNLQVWLPVNFTNVTNGMSDYDLTSTPFSFSALENVFVGVGSNIIAYTADRDDDVSVWCVTIGSDNQCDAQPRQNIQKLRPVVQSTVDKKVIILNSTRDQKDSDGYGFLASGDWCSDKIEQGLYYSLVSGEDVPVILNWELYNETAASFGADNATTWCGNKTQWFQVNNRFYSKSSFQCSCKDGYYGYPYIPYGCRQESPRYPYDEGKKIQWKHVFITSMDCNHSAPPWPPPQPQHSLLESITSTLLKASPETIPFQSPPGHRCRCIHPIRQRPPRPPKIQKK